MASAVAAIEIGFELRPSLALILDFAQSLPLVAPFDGHGVIESEGDKLDETGLVAMREVTARMPASKRFGRLFAMLLIQCTTKSGNLVGTIRRFHRRGIPIPQTINNLSAQHNAIN